jgi:acyl carrier protein
MKEQTVNQHTRILTAVLGAIDDVNQLLPPETQLAKSLDSPILGPTPILDSMGFVNFLGAVEERIASELNITFSFLSAETPLKREAFTTIGALVAHLERVLTQTQNDSLKTTASS